MRIGHGFDVHAFTEGDCIVLGGVTIPHSRGLLAHSDGDVLIHAICDALLGALGAGDIGRHFPDNDPANADIDSRVLLRRVTAMMQDSGWSVCNLDCTVIAQAPKLAAHVASMSSLLAEDLGCDADRVNIKATTTEGLGYTGREEGIAAHAVVLLEATGG